MSNPLIDQEILRSRPGSTPSWAPKIPDYEFKVDLIWITYLLSHFTYKPNWSFSVHTSGANPGAMIGGEPSLPDVHMKGQMLVEDSVRAFKPWTTDIEEPFNDAFYNSYREYRPFRAVHVFQPRNEVFPVELIKIVPFYIETEASFWDWVHEGFIPEMEHHEIDEWFKVKGQTPYNPHNPETAGKRLEGRRVSTGPVIV